MKHLCSERIFLWLEIGLILLVGGLLWLIVSTATGKPKRLGYVAVSVGAALLGLVHVVTSTGLGRGMCAGEWAKNEMA